MKPYKLQLEEYVQQIEATLQEFLAYNTAAEYAVVSEAMAYSVTAGGKRIRPVLTLEFCRAYGGGVSDALGFACALELIHCYSLVHDDLPCMDNDDLRRGKPSCHVKFGEANALLAGDGLLTLAFEKAAEYAIERSIHAKSALRCLSILGSCAGVNGMIGGQTMDLKYEKQLIDADLLTQVHRKKTGALIRAACTMGTVLATNGEVPSCVTNYADNLGLAFQVIDDILDVTGKEEELGKPIGSDADSGKTTYVDLYGLKRAKELAEDYTAAAVSALREIPQHDFLLPLTDALLNRRF